MECGGDAVAHHVGQNKTILIGIELSDGIEVAADDVVGHVERGELDARILGKVVLQGERLGFASPFQDRPGRPTCRERSQRRR